MDRMGGWIQDVIQGIHGASIGFVLVFYECAANSHLIFPTMTSHTAHPSFRDYNTRFSGLQLSQIDSASMGLVKVRQALSAFIGPSTGIVGHGSVLSV